MMITAATQAATAFLELLTYVGLTVMTGMSAAAISVICAKIIRAVASETAPAAALQSLMARNTVGGFTLGGFLTLMVLFMASTAELFTAAAALGYVITSVCLLSVASLGVSWCPWLVVSLGSWNVGMFWDFGGLRVTFR